MTQAFRLEELVPEYIKQFETYIPSRPDEELKKMYGCDVLYRLNNNENHLGPPAGAQEIIRSFHPPRAAIYPVGDSYYVKEALAAKFGKSVDQFLVGNGSTEVITSVIKAFCEKGDNIVTADRTFAVYEWVAQFSGYEARLVPLRDFCFDDEKMLEAIDERTKIVFICNPNNPTGTYWNEARLRSFLDRVDGRRIVVLDEAYFEYVDRPDFPDGMKLIDEYPNLVVFRTFSKMYALAALRIGYLAGSLEAVNLVKRAYVVYSVNSMAQAAAVEAINNGDPHVLRTREMVAAGKKMLTGLFDELELPYVCGEGNYVMVKAPISDMLLYRRLMKRGMMVRTMTGFRFPDWIRVSMSHLDVLEKFCAVFEDEIRKARDGR